MQFDLVRWGYCRVSTASQDLSNQRAQLVANGCERIFADVVSGATAERPELRRLLKALQPGTIIIIPAVDRLARDPTDLLVLVREMKDRGAGLRSLAEPIIDTTGDFAEVVLAILGVSAKLERRRILDRTARGRADARAKGVKFGRKPKLTAYQRQEAIQRLQGGETQRSVARSFNVSQPTIARLNRELGESR